MSDYQLRDQAGPIYGVTLIDSLPIGGMRQAMPSRSDLDQVRQVNERTVAGFEVLLSTYKRAARVIDYLDDPRVLCKIPQPHRIALSELLHSSADSAKDDPVSADWLRSIGFAVWPDEMGEKSAKWLDDDCGWWVSFIRDDEVAITIATQRLTRRQILDLSKMFEAMKGGDA